MFRKMKDSGVEWIGEIPEDWEITKISQLYRERNEKVNDKDYPPLSVTMKGIIPQLNNVAKSNNHENRKLVCKGDFAINSRSDRRGSCGISSTNGSVSLINTVLEPREKMNPLFYNWLFHTSMFSDEYYKWGHGIVDDLWTTNWNDMKRIMIPLPSISEQQKIANFLDEKISEIDKVIEKTKESIEEYKKYKQVIITEAVTKGLNSDVEMKDSGIEWIGEIPKGWKCKKVKYIIDSLSKGNGITKEDVKKDGNIQCVRYGEIYSKYDRSFENCISATDIEKISSPRYITKGDILFAATGELVEEIGKNIVFMGNEPCLVGGDIIIMKHSQNPIFLNYAMNSLYSQEQKSKGKIKLKVVHISAADIGNLLVALPTIEEQQQIADFLDEKCTKIDNLITKKEKLIKELEVYKKSLIYEYVTGKRGII